MRSRNDRSPGVLKQLERRYAWSVLGFVVGVCGIAITAFDLLHRQPRISFVNVASANVYDVHAPVQDLDISYRGQSLSRTNLSLKVLAVEVSNDGLVDILQNQYDDAVPWGFRITAGRIVEVKIVDASSDYLATRVAPRRTSDTHVAFNKVIFDSGATFIVSALVLHPNGAEPGVVPTGKIAGIDHFRTEKAEVDPTESLAGAFAGSAWTQGVRLLVYGLAFTLLFIATIALPAFIFARIENWRTARQRNLEGDTESATSLMDARTVAAAEMPGDAERGEEQSG